MKSRSISFSLLLLVVAAFPWDDALGYPTETLSVVKLLGLALGISFVIDVVRREEPLRSRFVFARTLPAVAIFVAILGVSLVASGDFGLGRDRALRYVQFAVLFVLLTQIVRTRRHIIVVCGVLTVSAACASVVGLVRFVTGAIDRASGPIGEANDFAYVLATALPLSLYLASRGGKQRLGWFAAAVVIGVGILGTLSRGSILGLSVAAVWMAARRRVTVRAVGASVMVLVVVAAGSLIFLHDFVIDRLHAKVAIAGDNVDTRLAFWRAALHMFADHPVLGVGTGLYRYRAAEYVVGDPLHIVQPVAHNAYLEILAENGVLGLAAFGAFIVGTWLLLRTAHRNATRSQDHDAANLVTALQASYIAALVGAAFLSVQITPPLWFIGALASAVVAVTAATSHGAAAGANP